MSYLDSDFNSNKNNERNKLFTVFAKFNFYIDGDLLEANAAKLLNVQPNIANLTNEQYDLLADYYKVPRHNEEIIVEIFIDNGTLFNDAIEMIMDKLSNQYGYETCWCDSNDEFLNNDCQNFDEDYDDY